MCTCSSWILERTDTERNADLFRMHHHHHTSIIFYTHRTAYLDTAVSNVIAAACNKYYDNAEPTEQHSVKVRLIAMGGGYDARSFKLIEHHMMKNNNPPPLLQRQRARYGGLFRRKMLTNPLKINLPPSNQYHLECYELDLPEVVQTKRNLIESRLYHKRPWLKSSYVKEPTLVEVDLNNLNQTRTQLESIINNKQDGIPTVNIILFEGVMIYLNKGVPHTLLEICSDVLRKHSKLENYLCFADRLDNIPGGDEGLARLEMEGSGWELEDWLSKPGLARHMGVASLRR